MPQTPPQVIAMRHAIVGRRGLGAQQPINGSLQMLLERLFRP